MFKTSDYHFDLPDELIAQYPLDRRDQSRLLHVEREKKRYFDRHFQDIVDLIQPNDCLVLNNTKVIPARLLTRKKASGGKVEVFLIRNLGEGKWEALTKPGKRAKLGSLLEIEDCQIRICEENPKHGSRIVEINYDADLDSFLEKNGQQPLPPYIKRLAEESDKKRYQTVYAEHKGAVAAPTAGLHFTDKIIAELQAKGVRIAPLTLHVGLGTFRPVKTESIKEHQMHEEFYDIPEESIQTILETKEKKGRVIAVGTTSMRTLESAFLEDGKLDKTSGWTDKFIYPSYKFRMVDALLTNFHTPASSLLMLVSAFAGYHFTKEFYQHAVQERYRFFSYGDSMFIS